MVIGGWNTETAKISDSEISVSVLSLQQNLRTHQKTQTKLSKETGRPNFQEKQTDNTLQQVKQCNKTYQRNHQIQRFLEIENQSFPTRTRHVGDACLTMCPGQENISVPPNSLQIPDRESIKRNQTMNHQGFSIDACWISQHDSSLPQSANRRQPLSLGSSQGTCLLKRPLSPGVLKPRFSFRIWVNGLNLTGGLHKMLTPSIENKATTIA